MELKFKEYFGLTTGKHNDYATAAYLPSDFTGSETFPNHIPHLSRTDLVMPNLPSQEIRGIIRKVNTSKDPCRLEIELPNGRTQIIQVDYDMLKRMVGGFTSPEHAQGKEITLDTQGYTKHGLPQIRWATITDLK
jgi:hypothetical protein